MFTASLSPLKADGGSGPGEGLGSIHGSCSLCCPSGISTHSPEAPKGTSLSSPASSRLSHGLRSVHHLFGGSLPSGEMSTQRTTGHSASLLS